MAIIKCPNCGKFNLKTIEESYIGKKVKCPKCNNIVMIEREELTDNNREKIDRLLTMLDDEKIDNTLFNSNSYDQQQENTVSSQEEYTEQAAYSVLYEIELFFKKMILGIVKYIFIKLPPTILRFLTKTFPLVTRISKICLLSLIWIVLLLWPLLIWKYNYFSNYISNTQLESLAVHQPFIFISNHTTLWFSITCIWIVLAGVGSLWGLTAITIKKWKFRWKQHKNRSN